MLSKGVRKVHSVTDSRPPRRYCVCSVSRIGLMKRRHRRHLHLPCPCPSPPPAVPTLSSSCHAPAPSCTHQNEQRREPLNDDRKGSSVPLLSPAALCHSVQTPAIPCIPKRPSLLWLPSPLLPTCALQVILSISSCSEFCYSSHPLLIEDLNDSQFTADQCVCLTRFVCCPVSRINSSCLLTSRLPPYPCLPTCQSAFHFATHSALCTCLLPCLPQTPVCFSLVFSLCLMVCHP